MIIYICLSETLAAHYWVNKLTLIFKIIFFIFGSSVAKNDEACARY